MITTTIMPMSLKGAFIVGVGWLVGWLVSFLFVRLYNLLTECRTVYYIRAMYALAA